MHGFRYYFTPLTGVLFTFRSRYYYAIGRPVVLSLGGWSPLIHTGFPVSGATWEKLREVHAFRLRDSHPLRSAFPCRSPKHELCNSLNPLWRIPQLPRPQYSNGHNLGTALVWAGPRSLAATEGVEVSFRSCRYLDVSVPCVPAARAAPGDESWMVSQSRRSSDRCLHNGSPKLFAAIPRPSSALDAKASTMHSS